MSALLVAEGVSAGYVGVDVIREIDIAVEPGEIVALLGPNGAGKTTTLLTLAGELRPTTGQVRWKDATRHVPLHRRARQGMAFVTEERSVFMQLSTRQNIGVGRCEIEQVTHLFPELAPLLERRAGLLSGGEQQMLTLGRALARPTDLLLADELSLGLAPNLVGRLLRAVRQAADEGMGALLVEQHVHRVLEIADRVVVLRQGRVAYTGSAAQARKDLPEIEAHYLTKRTVAAS
jgi:ABC-type branched-subunit amino acid transport system ATPase component